MRNEPPLVRLFRTSDHPCSYLENQSAKTLFLDPAIKINQMLHTIFSHKGYRRSGQLLYKPECKLCNACVS